MESCVAFALPQCTGSCGSGPGCYKDKQRISGTIVHDDTDARIRIAARDKMPLQTISNGFSETAELKSHPGFETAGLHRARMHTSLVQPAALSFILADTVLATALLSRARPCQSRNAVSRRSLARASCCAPSVATAHACRARLVLYRLYCAAARALWTVWMRRSLNTWHRDAQVRKTSAKTSASRACFPCTPSS